MGVVLALAAALGYGLSDFVGGIASRRTSAWPVATVGAVASLVGVVVASFAFPGTPTTADLLWGAVAGIGSGTGGAFLYRGFATGRMGVVAPVSAVGAALLPLLVGVGSGERPAPLVWVGIAAALPGIWLVSREPAGTSGRTRALGLADGVLAGLGFGLLFAATGQVPDTAGLWPLVVTQAVAVVAVVLTAVGLGARWVPDHPSQAWGAVAGLVATAAMVCFLLATQTGLLTVAAVLTSLYPAFTILLALAVLREHVHRGQAVGLLLCGVTVALVAAG
jgi:uncharacterized membrane protein